MNTSDLLEKMLRGGQGASAGGGGLGGLLGGLLGGGRAGAGAGSNAGGLGGGLGGLGGLLGGLLGGASSGQGRSTGKYSALASLGMMAFQAYQAWQRQQASTQASSTAPQQAFSTVDTLEGPAAEAHSHAILRALIAAAKADGTVDDREKGLIEAELEQHANDPELLQWLNTEVTKPLDVAEVAQAAVSEPGIAAEMYLASVILIGAQEARERGYLDELATALGLDRQLKDQLEQQAGAAAA